MELVKIGARGLAGDLVVPEGAKGVVVFAHGSGSSRHSPRNRYVSGYLNSIGFGTLLMDLLTESEDEITENRFDIPLLASRLEETLEWLGSHPQAGHLPVGLFGASTGAAAALDAAVRTPDGFFAVVSRGGRPDLATGRVGSVTAPVLLIVGGDDDLVIRLNESALRQLPRTARLEIVPGASHLFEEPGKLEAVAHLAGDWFLRHLPTQSTPRNVRRSHVVTH